MEIWSSWSGNYRGYSKPNERCRQLELDREIVKMKKKGLIATVAVAVILVLILSLLTSNPIVSCRTDLPEGYLSAIESQAKGVYSSRLPLVPVYISVGSVLDGKVLYTIYYFPFGTVGMSYTQNDGYAIEKPLTNQ